MRTLVSEQGEVDAALRWLNRPPVVAAGAGLRVVSGPRTDLWQRTHYGFQRDDGHCLVARFEGDFELICRVGFEPRAQYDQCGVVVRVDAGNWLKASIEYEDASHSRLGSVVTNLGYSDWATQDIASDWGGAWYRVSRRGADFRIEYGRDGRCWHQLRICHLHAAAGAVEAGFYTCSPVGDGYEAALHYLGTGPNRWTPPAG